jgi:hypothetical protein
MRGLVLAAGLVLMTGCAGYNRFNVMSSGANGVPVKVNPTDVVFRGDSTTAFQRIYKTGTPVTLTAGTVPNMGFDGWANSSNKNPVVTVVVAGDMDMTACYTNPPPPQPPHFIPGNKAVDGGAEMGGGSVGGMGLRYDANDGSKTPGVQGEFYFVDANMVKAQGGQEWHKEGTEWVFTAKNWVSPKTGLHYMFLGWTLYTSGSPLIQSPTIRVNENALHDVLRSYWGTVDHF